MNNELVHRLMNKFLRYSGTVGEKTVYYGFLLYYAAKNPHIPKSTKMIIVGALCYLFLPIDIIPDFIPVVGLADDGAVIAAALYKVFSHIDDHAKMQARAQVEAFINAKK